MNHEINRGVQSHEGFPDLTNDNIRSEDNGTTIHSERQGI